MTAQPWDDRGRFGSTGGAKAGKEKGKIGRPRIMTPRKERELKLAKDVGAGQARMIAAVEYGYEGSTTDPKDMTERLNIGEPKKYTSGKTVRNTYHAQRAYSTLADAAGAKLGVDGPVHPAQIDDLKVAQTFPHILNFSGHDVKLHQGLLTELGRWEHEHGSKVIPALAKSGVTLGYEGDRGKKEIISTLRNIRRDKEAAKTIEDAVNEGHENLIYPLSQWETRAIPAMYRAFKNDPDGKNIIQESRYNKARHAKMLSIIDG